MPSVGDDAFIKVKSFTDHGVANMGSVPGPNIPGFGTTFTLIEPSANSFLRKVLKSVLVSVKFTANHVLFGDKSHF
jgi:hypothetical protein